MHCARILRQAREFGTARLVGENSDKAAIARIKIEMVFACIINIRLFKNEWHAQKPLPKINRGLAISTNQCDMMNPLGLNFTHF